MKKDNKFNVRQHQWTNKENVRKVCLTLTRKRSNFAIERLKNSPLPETFAP